MTTKFTILGALILLACVGLVVFKAGGSPSLVQAQAPECVDLQPVNGVIPRCLLITKVTSPGGSTLDFDFDVDGDINDSFELGDGDSAGYSLGGLDLGIGDEITVSESVPTGWTLIIDCDADGFEFDYDDASVTITYVGSNEAFDWGECVFTNFQGNTPTPTRTPTATTTPGTPTPTSTPDRPNVGGIFGGLIGGRPAGIANQATPVPTAAAPAAVSPPNTGDGGLR